ncbi:MAG: DUF5666 domain-containing protein [Pseudomonadota bacterium]
MTGTGIVGEVTALGSLIVNDQRITFEADTPVSSALGQTQAERLVPGDTVAIAVEPGRTDWTAIAITQTHPLIGPVSDTAEGGFTALGVSVNWPEPPTPGTWVAVSGFWTPEGIRATRVDLIPPRDTISLQGSYSLGQRAGMTRVGTRVLDIEPLQHAAEGDVIRVTGTLEGGRIKVTDVHHGLFEKPVSLVLAEGYLSSVAPSGHYTVGGSGLAGYTDNLQATMDTSRIRVCGTQGQMGQIEPRENAEVLRRLGCPGT